MGAETASRRADMLDLPALAGRVRPHRSRIIAGVIGVLLLIVGISVHDVTRTLAQIEDDLPRFGFFTALETSATRRDAMRLYRSLELALLTNPPELVRERVSEASDLLYIRLHGLEDSWLTRHIADYDGWRQKMSESLLRVDDLLANDALTDLTHVEPLMHDLWQAIIEIDRIYYTFGDETNQALESHQSRLNDLRQLIPALLGLLTTISLATALLLVNRERALDRQNAAETMVNHERSRLEDAIDSLNDGFVLFDADDRLVLCNDHYRSLYPHSSPFMQPGISFEELIRAGVERGEYIEAVNNPEAFIEARMAAHRAADGRTIEQDLDDGRSIRVSELRTRDGGIVGIRSDITELKRRERALAESEKRYRFLASYDALTGLGNRSFFNDTLDCMLDTAMPGECRTSVLILDLDGFKEINDAFGHKTGDEVLKVVAGRILSILPDGGMAARVGADQFAVVVSSFGETETPRRLAENLLGMLEDEVLLGDQRLLIKANVGVASHPDHAETADDLFARADLALTRAKQVQRGSWMSYDSEFARLRSMRRNIEKSIERALREGEFDLAMQPKLALAEGRVEGLEALLRWHDPVRNVNVNPDEFIPIAESSALILDIDRHVVREGCRRAVALEKQHGLELSIAINLSGAHFRRAQLVDLVAEALDTTGLAPGLLEIEMTEGVLVQDRKLSEAIIQRLHDLGVKIALDDFGTGYSSLAYLRDLPIDRLKIDRSFIIGLENDRRNHSIVKTFVELGHELGLSVIAEGVETIKQMRILEALGCDNVQGYLISRPLMTNALRRWLEERRWIEVIKDLRGEDKFMVSS